MPVSLRSIARSGRNRSSLFLPGIKSCPAPDSMKSLAWPGRVRARFAAWTSRPTAVRPGSPPSFDPRHIPWRIRGLASTGSGTGRSCVIMSRCTDELGTVQPTRAEVAKYWNKPNDSQFPCARHGQYCFSVEDRQRWERSQWTCVSFSCVVDDSGAQPDCEGAVTHLRCGENSHRGRNSRLGYLDRPRRKGTSAGTRNRRGRREAFCSEGLRGMPRGHRFRRPGSYFDQERRQDQVPVSLPRRLA